jgi:hypothetical protein
VLLVYCLYQNYYKICSYRSAVVLIKRADNTVYELGHLSSDLNIDPLLLLEEVCHKCLRSEFIADSLSSL